MFSVRIGTSINHALIKKSSAKVELLLQRGANPRRPHGAGGRETAERMGHAVTNLVYGGRLSASKLDC